MRIDVNGAAHQVPTGTSIPDLLAILEFGATRGVAVAVDGEVIPRSRWDEVALAEGMRLEVLRAVQGG